MTSLRLGIACALALVAACGDDGGGTDASTPDASIDASTPPDAGAAEDAGPPRRVLFVGNSYTYVNDLPAVVTALGAATPGAAVTTETIAVGGATLYDHWVSTGARERIEAGGLDTVVMQGQSLEALGGKSGFEPTAAMFSGAIRDAGADGVWFATWARRAGDPSFPDPDRMTREIEYAYRRAADLDGDVLARVGLAWQIALAEIPGVVLHDADGSHPSPAGTLLAACVILQAITGEAPRVPDPPPLGVPAETARALCAIASRVPGEPPSCPGTQRLCDGACVEVQWDAAHCGACGAACPAEDPCRAGVCGCDAPYVGCARSCVVTDTDSRHCGGCGVACATGEVCTSGDCRCARAFGVPVTDIAGCDPPPAPVTPACAAATHAYCRAFGTCFDSGLPPPSGHAPVVYAALCVDGDVRATTYTTLSSIVAACDGMFIEPDGQPCATAIHRYCVSTGAVTGFGPVDTTGPDAITVTCLPSATIVRTPLDTLRGFASRCTPDPALCSVAAWNFCESMGHEGGFGPVEVVGTDVDVVCLDS